MKPTVRSNESSELLTFSDAEIALLKFRFTALEDSLEELYNTLPIGMLTLDIKRLFSKINRFELVSLGYEYSELLGRKKISDLLAPESRALYTQFLENPSRYQFPNSISVRLISKFGVVLPFRLSQSGDSFNASGSLRCVLCSDASLSQIDNRLRIAAVAFESQQGIMVIDGDKKILRVNSAFTAITDFSEEEVIGKTPAVLICDKRQETLYSEILRTINDEGRWQGPIWNKPKNGKDHAQYLSISEVRDRQGNFLNYVGTITDISEELATKETIENLADYDPLTSLPNKRLFMKSFERALAIFSRNDSKGAVLFLNLDNFKLINDSKGHDYADRLLQQFAGRLLASVSVKDTVARMGSDEFVVLLHSLGDSSEKARQKVDAMCTKIRATLLPAVSQVDVDYSITASIGVAMIEDTRFSGAELFEQANIAMYQAKRAGRNAQHFFVEKTQVADVKEVVLKTEIRSGLDNNEFELFYQLQVDQAGNAIGVEALTRWHHPTRGLLTPDAFIDSVQESDLICELGCWVLNEACRQLQQWAHDSVFKDLQVSVNLSAREFRQGNFIQQLESIMKQHKVRLGALKLELTEGILLENNETEVAKMRALTALGAIIELDNFGTGVSSLKYIKVFPISSLKIDQSFVSELTGGAESTIVTIRVIIAMARALGIEVIAGGVESRAQRELLEIEGCTKFQGYYIAKPMPLEGFEQFLCKRSK